MNHGSLIEEKLILSSLSYHFSAKKSKTLGMSSVN